MVYLPTELHRRLRLQSVRAGESMSSLVEQALEASLGPRRLQLPAGEAQRPEVVEALARHGAPLWSSGRPTSLAVEEAVARALDLSRAHPSLLRVLPVVLYRNHGHLSWPALRQHATDLPALGMLLELTAEVTGLEVFRSWALELADTVQPGPPVPFFEGKDSGRYLELARERTPGLVRRWGFLMATPLDDFYATMRRFCPDLHSTARS